MVSTRSSSVRGDSLPPDALPVTPATASRPRRSGGASSSSTTPSSSASSSYSHAPTLATVVWLVVSLPLVVWDTVYVLGRPATMEGGALHWPLYVPYKLYAEIDHVYGWEYLRANNGFTSAQGLLNVVETVMYSAYLWLFYANAISVGTKKAPRKVLTGRVAATAVLLGFSASLMTLSKTVLYAANEYFSSFSGVGHNNAIDLIFLYIIPNGAWLVFSVYMTWTFGNDILDGLSTAGSSRSKRD